MTDNAQTVIIDNGSGMIKYGFAGNENPRNAFPTTVGKLPSHANSDIYIGNDAYSKAGVIILRYPIEHGIVKNWDDMEKIWHHTFEKELKIDPAEHPVLITEAMRNPTSNREKMIQIFFETFNVPSFYIGPQAHLSLIGSGRITGIVCDIGEGVTQIVPIYNHYIFNKAIMRANFGGRDLTDYLQKMLNKRDNIFRTEGERLLVCEAKEKKTYVALDYEAELQRYESVVDLNEPFKLCDGKIITLSDERVRCPELLFKPYLNGFEYDGIDKMIFDSIMMSNIGARKDLFSNIILSGGCSMLKGFPERIEKEITNFAPLKSKIKVVAAPDRKDYVWIGGSILASLPTFQQMVIKHDEYNDVGPNIVHSKCI